jgi:branched-subunit amino acid transport protein
MTDQNQRPGRALVNKTSTSIMKTKFVMPVASLTAIVVGTVIMNNSEKGAIVGAVMLVAGMIGCLISIVKYKK